MPEGTRLPATTFADELEAQKAVRAAVRNAAAAPVRATGARVAGLREFLTIEAWGERSLPLKEQLLGTAFITRSTRAFIVGSTGLGKTNLGLALAVGAAAGTGFLHWRSSRPARVLYIDGEMPADLIKSRSIDALRRAQMAPKPGMLIIYSRDFEESSIVQFPSVGKMPPLNTVEGHNWVYALLDAIGDVDLVIFDNVMSLLSGVQKEEETWSEAMPLALGLTARNVGQIWFDHTGHDKTKQYGSSVKAWQFDTVGVMTSLPEDQRRPRELAFQLSFDAPAGKARCRTPANWADFDTTIIRLADDQWTSETATPVKAAAKRSEKEAKLSDSAALLLREVRELLASQGSLKSPGSDYPILLCISREELRRRLVERGWFADDLLCKDAESKIKLKREAYKAEWNSLNGLKRKGLCSFNNEAVWEL